MKKLVRVPHFRSLPMPLMWPNPEVLLFSMFSTGLLLVATTVMGAAAYGYATTPWNLAIAILVVVAVVAFYVHELCRILTFLRHHEAHSWNEAERPENKVWTRGSNRTTLTCF